MAAWRSTLLRCLASTEAIIDFGEDEEISSDVAANVLRMARQLCQHLQQHVTSSRCLIYTPQVLQHHERMNGLFSDVAMCQPTLNQKQQDKSVYSIGGVCGCRRGELIRSGIKVAIVGRPNAGKSSLLNTLAARDAAIVSSTPGTTRDTVEVSVDLAGHKVDGIFNSCSPLYLPCFDLICSDVAAAAAVLSSP